MHTQKICRSGGSVMKGKIFRKTATITVIKETEKGYLVYDGSNLDDQWEITTEVFNATYEEVK